MPQEVNLRILWKTQHTDVCWEVEFLKKIIGIIQFYTWMNIFLVHAVLIFKAKSWVLPAQKPKIIIWSIHTPSFREIKTHQGRTTLNCSQVCGAGWVTTCRLKHTDTHFSLRQTGVTVLKLQCSVYTVGNIFTYPALVATWLPSGQQQHQCANIWPSPVIIYALWSTVSFSLFHLHITVNLEHYDKGFLLSYAL